MGAQKLKANGVPHRIFRYCGADLRDKRAHGHAGGTKRTNSCILFRQFDEHPNQ